MVFLDYPIQMSGKWSVTFSNGPEETYDIITGGVVRGGDMVIPFKDSDNDSVFPRSEGWVMQGYIGGVWEYIRVSDDGSLLTVRRFSTEENCNEVYKGIKNYCDEGSGLRGEDGFMIGEYCAESP